MEFTKEQLAKAKAAKSIEEKNEKTELNEDQLTKVNGGEISINVFDDCHYNPSHFLDACDPRYWYPCECARCAYNAHRLWKDSVCTYPEIVGEWHGHLNP